MSSNEPADSHREPASDSRDAASEREQLEQLVPFLADDEILTTDWKLLKRDDLMTQGDSASTAKIVTVLDMNDPWQSGGRGDWLNPSSKTEGVRSWSEELGRRKAAVRRMLLARRGPQQGDPTTES